MPPTPWHSCEVFAAGQIGVVSGAAEGEALGPVELAHPGDIYQLAPDPTPRRLLLDLQTRQPRVAPGSTLGTPGAQVIRRGRLLLMSPDSDRVDLELLDLDGELHALPLSPMLPRTDYTLIRADPDTGAFRLSDLACASFVAGTRIALAAGGERPIESLKQGDLVLTRDHGGQPVRWIGRTTLRAHGAFAPIRFAPGVLGNADALQLSPHHRVFLYQRGDQRLDGRAEILVQARYLVDGQGVEQRDGGLVTYLALAFDRHEIVYAEGTPVESLAVSEATAARLPPALAEDLGARFPGLRQRPHFATEPDRPADDLRARVLRRRGD